MHVCIYLSWTLDETEEVVNEVVGLSSAQLIHEILNNTEFEMKKLERLACFTS